MSIDTSYVRRELKAIAGISRRVNSLLYAALERLESNPSSFPPLEEINPDIQQRFPTVTFRKVKLEHHKHSYRLIVAHWDMTPQDDHVDVIYAFSRKPGYPIDWDEVDQLLSE